MTTLKCIFKPFVQPLINPLEINKTTIINRKGYYILLQLNNATIGVGEISPLPGLSTESYNQISNEIKKITSIDINLDVSIFTYINNGFPIWSTLSSIQNGLESACLMILDYLSVRKIKSHYFINNLANLTESYNDQHIKCKVGINNPQDELLAINNIINNNPTVKFRFDANNRFTLPKAVHFFSQIPAQNIDYIEDPCPKNKFEEFFNQTNLKLGLDYPNLSSTKGVKGIIIKPTIVGSIEKIQSIKKQFPHKNLIFSSSFETPIGIAAIVRLASLFSPANIHGVNTLHYFNFTPALTQQPLFESLNKTNCKQWLT